MPVSSADPIIPVLGGATASGKSVLALTLAQRFGLELVSADAMMVYRELDVGTAKPTREERARVPHHLIDVVYPDEAFSVARYVTLAERAIGEVLARGRLPLVVGGTGFYIRAPTQGLPTTPAPDEAVQAALWHRLEQGGLDALEAELSRLSPEDARRAQRNPRRVVRALEVWERSGRSPTTFPLTKPRYRYSKRRLELESGALGAAITRRTQTMFQAGLVAEVERLLGRYPKVTTALQAIGYKEVRAFLEADVLDTSQMIEQVTQATWRYAKRQRTWFAKEPQMTPLQLAEGARWLAELIRTNSGKTP